MKFHGDKGGFGRPSFYTRDQHLEALAWFRAQNGRRGACAELATRYGCSKTAMKLLLKRAEIVDAEAKAAAA